MKRIFAIHDMSGIGKCSLTAAIPVISAMGIECNPIPTAVLSTHTGNITGYTFRDLTDDIVPYVNHWKKLDIRPDCIYSGYLASTKQVDYVEYIINIYKPYHPLVVIDPAMADSGLMYKGFKDDFVSEMSELCSMADVITPNLTEACFLTGTCYRSNIDPDFITDLVAKLKSYTGRYIVITGVSPKPDKTGCYVYDKVKNRSEIFSSEKCPGTYYGTGDIFASVLAGAMTSGEDCFSAAEKALNFTYKSIKETYENKTDTRLGVAFEKFLPDLFPRGGNI